MNVEHCVTHGKINVVLHITDMEYECANDGGRNEPSYCASATAQDGYVELDYDNCYAKDMVDAQYAERDLFTTLCNKFEDDIADVLVAYYEEDTQARVDNALIAKYEEQLEMQAHVYN